MGLTELNYTTLHYTTLHYTTLHFGPRDDALDKPLYRKGYLLTQEDLALISDPEYNAFVQVFVENEEVFEHVFAKASTEIINADRYDGPDANVCSKYYVKY